MFANSKDAAWNQKHVAAVTKPKIITELFAYENKGIKLNLLCIKFCYYCVYVTT